MFCLLVGFALAVFVMFGDCRFAVVCLRGGLGLFGLLALHCLFFI